MPTWCMTSVCACCERSTADHCACLRRENSGKPDAGNRHVRFDEGGGGRETGPSATLPFPFDRDIGLLCQLRRTVGCPVRRGRANCPCPCIDFVRRYPRCSPMDG